MPDIDTEVELCERIAFEYYDPNDGINSLQRGIKKKLVEPLLEK